MILCNFTNEVNNLDKGPKSVKKFFLNNIGLIFGRRKKVLHGYKSRVFSKINKDKTVTPEPAPELAPEPALKPAREPTPETAREPTINRT